jgi:hypothetical protein
VISTTSGRSCYQISSLKAKAPNEVYAILTETLWEHASSYATVKNWVAQVIRGDFSPLLRLVLDDTKQ